MTSDVDKLSASYWTNGFEKFLNSMQSVLLDWSAYDVDAAYSATDKLERGLHKYEVKSRGWRSYSNMHREGKSVDMKRFAKLVADSTKESTKLYDDFQKIERIIAKSGQSEGDEDQAVAELKRAYRVIVDDGKALHMAIGRAANESVSPLAAEIMESLA